MRIRSIKPEFWRSTEITELDVETRLLFIGLWSYVDDNGVGRDELQNIVGDLFAGDLIRDSRETVARVSRGLETLSAARKIVRYEVDGKRFLAIVHWGKHQRIDKPSKPRYPSPDAENAVSTNSIRETVARAPETPSPGTGEQGNRGTEEQGNSKSSSDSHESDPKTEPKWKTDLKREDINAITTFMDDSLAKLGFASTSRNRNNVTAARLMIDSDGHTVDQIVAAIEWAHNDEFWRSNIQSLSKLREKYQTLQLQAQRTSSSSAQQKARERSQANLAVVAQLAHMSKELSA